MVLQHKGTGEGYIVSGNYGKYVIAIQSMHITNPNEWWIITNEPKEKEKCWCDTHTNHNLWDLNESGWPFKWMKARFCPECGRKLW